MKSTHLTLALIVVTSSLGAQPRTQERIGGPTTAIRRQTTTNSTNFGEMPAERTLAPGEVGGTGEAISRGPQTQLRGGVEPPPDAIDMSRPVGPGDVARIVRARDPQFRACYERGRARVRALQGRVNIRFVVTPTGALSDLDVRGLPQAPEVASCIRENLSALRLPRPDGGRLVFTTGVNFSPPAAPPPRRGRARAARR